MNKINILYLHSSAELYGSDRSLLNTVTRLDESRFSVLVVLPCNGPLVDSLRRRGIETKVIDYAILRRKNLNLSGMVHYLRTFISSVKSLIDVIDRYDIDIVDVNTAVVLPGPIAARITHKKCVWHVREIISNRFENAVISILLRCLADVVIANSKATARSIRVPKNQITTIYNGIDTHSYTAEYEANKFPVYVGMAGRINRWKGQELFIRAAIDVIKEIPDVKFLIAGSAYAGEEQYEASLRQLIIDNHVEQNIVLLGQVDDMAHFYNQLTVFILPSIEPEPFGLVVVEAMASSIPVIATSHGGPTEIIDDGVDGCLVDWHDSHEMSKAIIKVLKDPLYRKSLAVNGKNTVLDRFSIEVMVNNIEQVYLHLLRENDEDK